MQKKAAHLIDRAQTIYADEVYVYLASDVDPLRSAVERYLRYLKVSLDAGPSTNHPGREGELLDSMRNALGKRADEVKP